MTDLSHLTSLDLPSQLPRNVKLFPLPPEIDSWICQTLLLSPKSKKLESNRLMRNEIERGAAGSSSARSSTPTSTSTSPTSRETPELRSSSSPVSSRPSEQDPFLEEFRLKFQEGIAKKPSATWQRSSGVTFGYSPATTMLEDSTESWRTRSEAIGTQIHHRTTRKRQHHVSFGSSTLQQWVRSERPSPTS